MTVERWLKAAQADAERRHLPGLLPLLEGLAESLGALRSAHIEPRADGWHAETEEGSSPSSSRSKSPAPLSTFTRSDGPRPGPERRGSDRPTIEELGRRLRDRSTTAVALLEECLGTIDRANAHLNALVLVASDEARRQADLADAELAAGLDRGPLHGIPITLKDLIDVQGQPTSAASGVRRGHRARSDAEVVTYLKRAGAVLVGKTNLHEFAFGTTSEDSAFGPVRHPADGARSPGGSSGGSAVAVATGMSVASIGTDTGGSIRIPAAACGVVGFKPPFGEVSTDGVVPLSRTLDHVGPIASCVTDAWHVYRALCGQHDLSGLREADLRRVRLAVPRRYFCDLLEPDLRRTFDATLEQLRATGTTIEDVDVGDAELTPPVYLPIVFSEAAVFHASALDATPERYTVPVRLRLEMARYVLAEDYLRALAGRDLLRIQVERALDTADALVLPTLPIAAPTLGQASVSFDGTSHPVRNLMLRLTQLFNITGHPALTLPCRAGTTRLPVGLQLVGRHHAVSALFQLSVAIERAIAGNGDSR